MLQASDRAGLIQAVSLIHEVWFKWHSALWSNRASAITGSQGPLLLHGAMRSRLEVDMAQGGVSPIKHHQAKALQLKLMIRHLTRSHGLHWPAEHL